MSEPKLTIENHLSLVEDTLNTLKNDIDITFHSQNLINLKKEYKICKENIDPLFQISEYNKIKTKLIQLNDMLAEILEKVLLLNNLWIEIDNEFEIKWKTNLIWINIEQNKNYAKTLLQSGLIDLFNDSIELIKINYKNLKDYRQNEKIKYHTYLKRILNIVELNDDLLSNYLSQEEISYFKDYKDTIINNSKNINDAKYVQRGNLKIINEKINRLIIKAKKNRYKAELVKNLGEYIGNEELKKHNLNLSDESINKEIYNNSLDHFFSQKLELTTRLNKYL